MGAWAVKYPQQPVVLALHFGISLIALAAVTLTAVYVRRADEIRASPPVWPGLRLATWGITAYLYLLVYSGAYIRHAGAAGRDLYRAWKSRGRSSLLVFLGSSRSAERRFHACHA